MSGLVVETQPEREPLTVIETRDSLRLDDDVDESLVMSYIIAAREWAENYTGRALITRTMQQWMDGFVPFDMPLWEGWKTGPDIVNYQNHIELALAPAISVSNIKYYNDGDAEDLEYAVTVAGGVIVIDGASQPTLTLKRGSTYTFKQDDNSNTGHPFKFSTAEHGSHGGGNEYTTGVTFNGTAGSTGSYTKIVVDASAPDALYYYCGNHSNMGGALTITDQDEETIWPAKNYYVDTIREPARVILRDGGSYPTELRAANAIKITYTAGYGATAQNVPEPIRIAMMQYCAFMYEHRGDGDGGGAPVPPKLLTQLLTPYQIMRFGSTPYKGMVRAGIG
jgi:hypothetical protein